MFLIKKTIQTMLLTSYYKLVQMLQASYNTDSMEDIPPAFVSVHVKLTLLNINCNDKMKPFLQTTEKREMVHCLKIAK